MGNAGSGNERKQIGVGQKGGENCINLAAESFTTSATSTIDEVRKFVLFLFPGCYFFLLLLLVARAQTARSIPLMVLLLLLLLFLLVLQLLIKDLLFYLFFFFLIKEFPIVNLGILKYLKTRAEISS